MEFNIVLEIIEVFATVFSMFFSALIDCVPSIVKLCITLNKMKPINLLCIGLGIPTIVIPIGIFVVKRIISDI